MSDDRLRNKLNRFGGLLAGQKDASGVKGLPDRYARLARSVGGEIRANSSGAYCLTRTLYPSDYCHGKCSLADAVKKSTLSMEAFVSREQPEKLPVASMLFIDTETTGLGGVGTVAFLVGCGSVVPGGFEVRQYLLPDYSDEAALLTDLLDEFTDEAILVSYNGATFDMPILRDRMIVNRVCKEPSYAHHVDLLHSARRLFRRRLQDCRLTNIEAELFGFGRTDDIPGYLIPSAYFEWLSQENLELMPLILEHNRLDIVTLYFLLGHVGEIFESKGEVLSEVDDLHSLSRFYGRRKENLMVRQVFDRMDLLSAEDLADDIVFYHSMNFKRLQQYEQAVAMWRSLCDSDSKEGFWANVELAKYFEHRVGDSKTAYTHARKAEIVCPYGRFQPESAKETPPPTGPETQGLIKPFVVNSSLNYAPRFR